MLEEENYYLKGILSKVSGETVKGRLNNNQLLKLINENIGTGGGADLSEYIKKSDTAGLVKNDGTIDTSTYLTQHQDISGKLDADDLDTLEITITYEDTTSETVNIAVWSD